jgi:RNA polymerase sigma factor (sigma-70 family)
MRTSARRPVRCQDARATDPLVATVGDADAEYDLVFTTEFPAVMRAVYAVVHDLDRAEDITQDAFVRLLRHWKKVSKYERPGAWVRRVALNLAISSARRERRRRVIERNMTPASDRPTGDDEVLRAIQSLPPMQRAAVVLFYLEDQPVSEVAHVLGCAESTARVHLHRARRRLAEVLGEEVPEDAT